MASTSNQEESVQAPIVEIISHPIEKTKDGDNPQLKPILKPLLIKSKGPGLLAY
jgi:hypothetical protein